MQVSFTDALGDRNAAVFYGANGSANEPMRITYNGEEALTVVPQDAGTSVDVEFFYSTGRVRGGEVLVEAKGTASMVQVLKVRCGRFEVEY